MENVIPQEKHSKTKQECIYTRVSPAEGQDNPPSPSPLNVCSLVTRWQLQWQYFRLTLINISSLPGLVKWNASYKNAVLEEFMTRSFSELNQKNIS